MNLASYQDSPSGDWIYTTIGNILNASVTQKAQSILRAVESDYSIMKGFYLVFNAALTNGLEQQILGPQIKTIRRTSSIDSVSINTVTRQFQMSNDLRIYNTYLISDQNLFIAEMTGSSFSLETGEIHQLQLDFALL